MKRLLATKITRTHQSIGDYISAKEHAGHEGLAAFAARQRERAEAAQAVREEAAKVVRPIAKRKT